MKPLFDVVIHEIETGEIHAIIGENMERHDGKGSGRNTAEQRQATGYERINDMFDCSIVEAGKYKKGDKLETPTQEGGL